MSDCTHDCSTCGESCGERKEASVLEKKPLRDGCRVGKVYGVVSGKAEFLGGAIGPGLRMMNRALSAGTAKLPSIELVLPPQVIGKTTVSNIQAGILYGYIGSVEKIVEHMKHELGGSDIRVIATGGMAHLVKSNSDVIDEINPDLTLTGLRLIYERNL